MKNRLSLALSTLLITIMIDANEQPASGNDQPVWCSCHGHFTDRQAGKRYFVTSFVFHLTDRISVTSCKSSTNDFRTSVENQYPAFRAAVAPVWCVYSFTKSEAVASSRKRLNDAKGNSYFEKAFAFGYAGAGEPIAGTPEVLRPSSKFCDNLFLSKQNYQKLGEGRYCGRATGLLVICEDRGRLKSDGNQDWSMRTIERGC